MQLLLHEAHASGRNEWNKMPSRKDSAFDSPLPARQVQGSFLTSLRDWAPPRRIDFESLGTTAARLSYLS